MKDRTGETVDVMLKVLGTGVREYALREDRFLGDLRSGGLMGKDNDLCNAGAGETRYEGRLKGNVRWWEGLNADAHGRKIPPGRKEERSNSFA